MEIEFTKIITVEPQWGGLCPCSRKFVVREIPSDERVKGQSPENALKKVTAFSLWGVVW